MSLSPADRNRMSGFEGVPKTTFFGARA